MGKRIFVWHHLGLGDHLVMNGFIHTILEKEKPSELTIVVKPHNISSVKMMFQDISAVKLHPIQESFELVPGEHPGLTVQKMIQEGVLYVGCGVHGFNARTYLSLDPCWANCFYKEAGLEPEIRWKNFQFPNESRLRRSKELCELVLKRVGYPYILIHDDPSRNFKLDADVLKQLVEKDDGSQIPVLYLGKKRYEYPLVDGLKNIDFPELSDTETLFDYCHILANAAICHMMDSSAAILLDYVDCRPEQKRYMHEYAKVGEILSTEGLFQKKWVILK